MTDFYPTNIPEIGKGTTLSSAINQATTGNQVILTGVRGGALAPLLTLLNKHLKKPIAVITESASNAVLLAQDLEFHAWDKTEVEKTVLHFPTYNLGPYDELASDRRSSIERSRVLFHLLMEDRPRFLVISADSLMRRIVPAERFQKQCALISSGDTVDRDILLHQLEQGGYYRVPLVEEPGTYAVRGSLIDVFPPYLTKPVRLDFFGPEVERIRYFDAETQSSSDEVSDVWIHPTAIGSGMTSDENRHFVAERIRTICDDVDQPTTKTALLLEEVLSNRVILAKERYAPAFHEQLETLFDYLPKDTFFCIEDQFGIKNTVQKQNTALEREYDRLKSLNTPVFPPSSHALTADEVMERCENGPSLLVQSLPIQDTADSDVSSNDAVIDLSSDTTSKLNDRLRAGLTNGHTMDILSPLERYIRQLVQAGYRIGIVAHTFGQADRLKSMLASRGLKISESHRPQELRRPGLVITSGELARGCLLPADGLVWIAEEEIFGHRTRRRRGSFQQIKSSLEDLKSLNPGDLVVHVEHGIGRYEGLIRQRIRSAEMDFLLISYRGGDKLYLPVYRLNQVQKYRGGGPEQRLDKLGGQTFQTSLAKAKKATQEMAGQLLTLYAKRMEAKRTPFTPSDELYREFEASFPFEETDGQARAIDETMADMDLERPMDRLVCGDVGFGKTEVAMRAAFRAAMSGCQTALLVPTTVLAQQHSQSFQKRFAPYPIRIEMLSRFRTPKQNKDTVLAIKEGLVDVAIGTHRLLSKDVHFKNLGLLIIDEEHRFGVAHKERIRSLRASVDTLVLTATPIPRTLQMSIGGIRDLSLIGTAPAERRPIKTQICHDDPKILQEAIQLELQRGGQVFFVHNRVKDIHKVASRVSRLIPDARIGVGHGQMKESELENVMLDFVSGRYDILVCTTIIESGLDIPRANTIIIDRADTFGMAQLYQLRGRVGRSSEQAYAYLVVPPLSVLSNDAAERVETLARYTDLGSGFSVATMDMELRGAGNLIGPEQSGNVAAVGIEMFCHLLEEASADLRGEPIIEEIEPEMTLEQPGFIPESYVPDVGQRLQFYKRLASASHETAVERIAAELTDRYGPLPEEAEDLISGMVAKAICRSLKIRGLEVTGGGLTAHLAPDTLVDPDTVIRIMRTERGRVQLTDDLKIKVDFSVDFSVNEKGSYKSTIRFLHRLQACDNNLSIS